MSSKAWVASNSGLPCVYSSDDVDVKTLSGRVLRRAGGPVPFIVRDLLARPGESTEYMVGMQSFTLTRQAGTAGDLVFQAVDGTRVEGLKAQPVSDLYSYQSNAKHVGNGFVRAPLQSDPVKGKTVALAFSESTVDDVWDVVKSRRPVILAPGALVSGVGLKIVMIQDMDVERLNDQVQRLTFNWLEIDQTRVLDGGLVTTGLTWGEWADYGGGVWQAGQSVLTLANVIMGMPS